MPRTQGFNRTRGPRGAGGGGGDNSTLLMNVGVNAISLADPSYHPVQGNYYDSALATEFGARSTAPRNGTVRKLFARVTNAPGAGKSWVITFRVNGINTALTCTIANLATTASDLVNTVNITAGQTLSVEWQPNGGPADPIPVQQSMECITT